MQRIESVATNFIFLTVAEEENVKDNRKELTYSVYAVLNSELY